MSSNQSVPARLLPSRVSDHLRFARARRAWRGAGMVFVHVPKNAGVSISRAIYGRPLGHYSVAEIQRRDPRLLAQTYSFATLRDPVERLVSAYRFARAGSTSEMAVAEPQRYQAPVFGDFNSFVCQWLVRQDLAEIDGIFRTQASYLLSDDGPGVTDLFCLPDLQPLIEMLRSRVRQTVVLEHRNATDKSGAVAVSGDAAEVVRHLYRADYDLIGACAR